MCPGKERKECCVPRAGSRIEEDKTQERGDGV